MSYFGEKVCTLNNVDGVIAVADPMYFDNDDELTFFIPVASGDYDCYAEYNEDLERFTSMAVVKSDYNGSRWKKRERILKKYDKDYPQDKDCIVWVDTAAVSMYSLNKDTDEIEEFETPSGYGDGAYPIYYWCDKHWDIVALQVKFIEDNGDLVHGTKTVPFEEVMKVFEKGA